MYFKILWVRVDCYFIHSKIPDWYLNWIDSLVAHYNLDVLYLFLSWYCTLIPKLFIFYALKNHLYSFLRLDVYIFYLDCEIVWLIDHSFQSTIILPSFTIISRLFTIISTRFWWFIAWYKLDFINFVAHFYMNLSIGLSSYWVLNAAS